VNRSDVPTRGIYLNLRHKLYRECYIDEIPDYKVATNTSALFGGFFFLNIELRPAKCQEPMFDNLEP
jgi:hypothetical protein